MTPFPTLPLLTFPLILLVLLIASSFKILKEYERGVVFTLGRFWGVKGPGLIIVVRPSSRWSESTRAPACLTYCRRMSSRGITRRSK